MRPDPRTVCPSACCTAPTGLHARGLMKKRTHSSACLGFSGSSYSDTSTAGARRTDEPYTKAAGLKQRSDS